MPGNALLTAEEIRQINDYIPSLGSRPPGNHLAAILARLASIVNGRGASLIGVEDVAADIVAEELEGAIAELAALRNNVDIVDPGNAGAISVARGGSCSLVTAGAETRTLAAPSRIGQTISLYFQTDGGNCVVTVASAINRVGNTVITFADVNESVRLIAVHNGVALAWRVISTDFLTGALS